MRAGVVSSVVTSRLRYSAPVAVAAVLALLFSGTAAAQNVATPLRVLTAPVITGTPAVGNTLASSGGVWQSPNPSRTLVSWVWYSCPRTTGDCDFLSIAPFI